MCGSFKYYSWIQDFEVDFPQKVSLEMLNKIDLNSFSDLFSVLLWAIDHLNLKLLTLFRHKASFKIWILKGQDFWNYELSSMWMWHCCGHHFVRLSNLLLMHQCIVDFITLLYMTSYKYRIFLFVSDENSNRYHHINITIDHVTFPLQNALIAGQTTLDKTAQCYIRYKFYDKGTSLVFKDFHIKET